MKTKVLLILLIISVGLNLGVLIEHGHYWMMRREFAAKKDGLQHSKRLQKKLNLTEAQVKLLAADHEKMEKIVDPIKNELRAKRTELMGILAAENVDEAKANALIGQISALQSKLEKIVLDNAINMRKNLTPEQQKKFKELLHKDFDMPPPFVMGFGPIPGCLPG